VIARLRRRHRAIFGALALCLPVALVAALEARRDVPQNVRLEHGGIPGFDGRVKVSESQTLVRGVGMRTRTWDDNRLARRVLELTPERDLELPDVLVYWAPSEATEELPQDGILLGVLAGAQQRRFALPREAVGGRLYWYSLAHQELIASAEFDR
jgi:hypothetical protein